MKKIVIVLFGGLIMSMGSKPSSGTASAVMSDSSGPHSNISSRARGKALQTDKFPRPPEHVASGTTRPKTKY